MNRPIFDLSSRRALVTGASRGIGQAIAVALAEAGADVAVTARALEGLAETRALVEKAGRRCVALVQDVRDVEASAAVTAVAADALGGLDILINNAGFENVRPSFDVDEALWESILSTNLKGAFFCAQAAGRIMARSGGGAIVNLCSLTSYVGIPTAVPYGSSKTGLLGMTRALAAEWGKLGIRVNAVAAGLTQSKMTAGTFAQEAWTAPTLARTPAGRLGTPEDIAQPILFLTSPGAAWVTGQTLPIDGGYTVSG